MHSGERHKLYDVEATPPPGLWNKIEAGLDDAANGAQFPSTLANAEQTPPAHCWATIATELDDSANGLQFPSTLANASQDPPPHVWAAINAELEDSEWENQFRSKVYTASIIPAAHNWSAITGLLDESSLIDDYRGKLASAAIIPPATAWAQIQEGIGTESIIPQQRRIPAWMKYAAAAMVLGCMAWGANRLLNTRSSIDEPVATTPLVTQPSNTIASTQPSTLLQEDLEAGVAGLTASLDEARNDAALEASKKTYASLDHKAVLGKIKNVSDFMFISEEYDYPTPSTTRSPFGSARCIDCPPPVIPAPEVDFKDRYVVLLSPDGNYFRISKKLGDMVCCVSGEDVDKDCVDQMKKWRDRIANPANSHSPGNFMDVVNMISSLEEN